MVYIYQKYISIDSLPYTTSLDTEDDVNMYLSSVYNDIIIKDVMTRKKYKMKRCLEMLPILLWIILVVLYLLII